MRILLLVLLVFLTSCSKNSEFERTKMGSLEFGDEVINLSYDTNIFSFFTIVKRERDGYALTVNGKSYGPFPNIVNDGSKYQAFLFDSSGTHWWAEVYDHDRKFYFLFDGQKYGPLVHSSYYRVKGPVFSGSNYCFGLNMTGKGFMVYAGSNVFGPYAFMENMYPMFTTNNAHWFGLELTNNGKYFVYDGARFGPYDNIWCNYYDEHWGKSDDWYIRVSNKLARYVLVNGVEYGPYAEVSGMVFLTNERVMSVKKNEDWYYQTSILNIGPYDKINSLFTIGDQWFGLATAGANNVFLVNGVSNGMFGNAEVEMIYPLSGKILAVIGSNGMSYVNYNGMNIGSWDPVEGEKIPDISERNSNWVMVSTGNRLFIIDKGVMFGPYSNKDNNKFASRDQHWFLQRAGNQIIDGKEYSNFEDIGQILESESSDKWIMTVLKDGHWFIMDQDNRFFGPYSIYTYRLDENDGSNERLAEGDGPTGWWETWGITNAVYSEKFGWALKNGTRSIVQNGRTVFKTNVGEILDDLQMTDDGLVFRYDGQEGGVYLFIQKNRYGPYYRDYAELLTLNVKRGNRDWKIVKENGDLFGGSSFSDEKEYYLYRDKDSKFGPYKKVFMPLNNEKNTVWWTLATKDNNHGRFYYYLIVNGKEFGPLELVKNENKYNPVASAIHFYKDEHYWSIIRKKGAANNSLLLDGKIYDNVLKVYDHVSNGQRQLTWFMIDGLDINMYRMK